MSTALQKLKNVAGIETPDGRRLSFDKDGNAITATGKPSFIAEDISSLNREFRQRLEGQTMFGQEGREPRQKGKPYQAMLRKDGSGKYIETPEHLKAFHIWYANGRNYSSTAKILQCGVNTVHRFARVFEWVKRADRMDQEAKEASERDVVNEVATMLKTHYDAAGLAIARGLEFLQDNPITNHRDALQAIKIGIELQRRQVNLPDVILQITQGSNDELKARAQELVQQIAQSQQQAIAQSKQQEAEADAAATSASEARPAYLPDPDTIEAEFVTTDPDEEPAQAQAQAQAQAPAPAPQRIMIDPPPISKRIRRK